MQTGRTPDSGEVTAESSEASRKEATWSMADILNEEAARILASANAGITPILSRHGYLVVNERLTLLHQAALLQFS